MTKGKIENVFEKYPRLFEAISYGAMNGELSRELDGIKSYDKDSDIEPLLLALGALVKKTAESEVYLKRERLTRVGQLFAIFCLLPFEYGIYSVEQVQVLLIIAGGLTNKIMRIVNDKETGTVSSSDLRSFCEILWTAKERIDQLKDFAPEFVTDNRYKTLAFVSLSQKFITHVTQDRPPVAILESLGAISDKTPDFANALPQSGKLSPLAKGMLYTIKELYAYWQEL